MGPLGAVLTVQGRRVAGVDQVGVDGHGTI
jgi:hypothetical protein